jgi:hypothetical protein
MPGGKIVPVADDKDADLDRKVVTKQISMTAQAVDDTDSRLDHDSSSTQLLGRFEPQVKDISRLMDQGKLQEAETLCSSTLGEVTTAFGPDSVECLKVTGLLANIQQRQNKLKDSESMHKLTLEGYEKLYGVDGVETLTAVHNYAGVLHDHKKLEEAATMYARALDGRERYRAFLYCR